MTASLATLLPLLHALAQERGCLECCETGEEVSGDDYGHPIPVGPCRRCNGATKLPGNPMARALWMALSVEEYQHACCKGLIACYYEGVSWKTNCNCTGRVPLPPMPQGALRGIIEYAICTAEGYPQDNETDLYRDLWIGGEMDDATALAAVERWLEGASL